MKPLQLTKKPKISSDDEDDINRFEKLDSTEEVDAFLNHIQHNILQMVNIHIFIWGISHFGRL